MALFDSEALRSCSLDTERAHIMGSILFFKPREAVPRPGNSEPSTPAKVIMFTGVRYERAAATETAMKWTSAGWMAPFQPNPMPRT